MQHEMRALARELAQELKERYGKNSLTAKEMADHLGVTPEYVCQKISDHVLPGYKDGRTYVVPIDSLAIWEVMLARTEV